jgi:hypothetical protein
MNPVKPHNDNIRKHMRKAARPSGSVDSSNPRRWRGNRLHHHSADVRCVFMLCVAVSSGCLTHYIFK